MVLSDAAISQRFSKSTHSALPFVQHDGGRSIAGYRGEADDCVVRAIAIAAELPYQQVYDELRRRNEHFRRTSRSRTARSMKSSTPRSGTHRQVYHPYLLALGFTWNPTMGIGTGCRVHLRVGELPAGRLIASLSRHLAAVVDGKLYDTHDCSRNGTRCVYGYYQRS